MIRAAGLAWVVLLAALPAAAEDVTKSFGPYDLPADTLMIMPDQRRPLSLPQGRFLTSVEMTTADGGGKPVSGEHLCHSNIGPAYRNFEHGRKILLDGYTRKIVLPAGLAAAFHPGEVLSEVMYNNPGHEPMKGVTTRFVVGLAPFGAKGLTIVYPSMMSVFEQPAKVAAGHWGYYVRARAKDQRRRLFDALNDFSIHHVSFHIHEQGRRIRLHNRTTGEVLSDVSMRYESGKIVEVPQVSLPRGVQVKKGQVLELIVDYDNALSHPVDAMGAAMLFARCTSAPAGCETIAQRKADNNGFDAKTYYSLVKTDSPRCH